MSADLRGEIKQSKPFRSLEEEAMLNLARTEAVLAHAFGDALKPYAITATQYNVLRILRGAGERGLCRHEVRDRLISPVPDVTRLLDRLEEAQLVVRERGTEDRRLVSTKITTAGLQLLEELDAPIEEIHQRQLGHLSEKELRRLIELLTAARSKV